MTKLCCSVHQLFMQLLGHTDLDALRLRLFKLKYYVTVELCHRSYYAAFCPDSNVD